MGAIAEAVRTKPAATSTCAYAQLPLDNDDHNALNELSAAEATRLLRNNGHHIGATTIRAHRRGDCVCSH